MKDRRDSCMVIPRYAGAFVTHSCALRVFFFTTRYLEYLVRVKEGSVMLCCKSFLEKDAVLDYQATCHEAAVSASYRQY